jgi:hypothetical protein
MAGSGGIGGSGGSVAIGETGRMVGMTAAHNAVRATVSPSDPLPDLTWNTDIAAVAQAYADQLASSGCNPVHSNGIYGENLAWYYNYQATAAEVVDGWAAEVACWPYGAIAWDQATQRDPNCDLACSGCGHYTQIVWRDTTELGCGVASCPGSQEIWVCNYNPQGNYTGQYPY